MEGYTIEQATACARIVRAGAQIPVAISVFGSIAQRRSGRDVDLLLEVPLEIFREYEAAVAARGMHPQLKALNDPGALFWSYFSPSQIRAESSLACIGINIETWGGELNRIVPVSKIDMICLPVGWRNREWVVRQELEQLIRKYDPDFFGNLEKTAKLIE